MSELKNISAALKEKLQAAGITKYSLTLSEGEKQELNTEHNKFSLFRTIFSHGATITAYLDSRKGSASGNDLSDAGLQKLVEDAKAGAESSMPDDANDIAEQQAPEVFRTGCYEADMARFYDRLQEVLDTVRQDFPKIMLMQIIGSHDKSHSLLVNSNSTEFEWFDGSYSVSLEFAGNDGEKTTGLGYGGVTMHDLAQPILSHGSLRKQLEDTEKSLNTVSIGDKFEGTVIFTPDALGYFTYMLVSNFMDAGVIIEGTSQWLDKVGQQVASDKSTLRLQAQDDRLVVSSPFTGDGFRAENVTLIEKGVLNCHLLNLYAAKKTGRPVVKNSGSGYVMEPGDLPVADMIKGVKRGLIVGGFSGGQPGANGEFSGVAKNSFYVENGVIRGAVMETMINGNLQDVFTKVTAVSKELVSDGNMAFPYLAVEGITISGN